MLFFFYRRKSVYFEKWTSRRHGTQWARIEKNVHCLYWGSFLKKSPNRGNLRYWPSKFWKIQRGDPSMSKKFSSPILMKLKIWNRYCSRIWHMKFEQNRRQKFFWNRRVPPLVFWKIFFSKGGPFRQKIFCFQFWRNSKIIILMAWGFAT